MRVVIDPDSGFCFGVNRAIQTAENELKAGNTVYCLGEMVHNQVQMDQLKSKGLRIITHADLYNLKGETVMIRAHGEPPETFRLAEELGISNVEFHACDLLTAGFEPQSFDALFFCFVLEHLPDPNQDKPTGVHHG